MRRLGVGVLLIGWFLAPALPAAQAFEGTLKWRLVQVDKDALKRVVGESPEADKVFAIPMEKLMSMHGDAKVTDATVYVKGSKVRAETTAAGGQGYFVMDIDTGVTQVVVPSEKKVMEITKQDVQLMEKRSEAAKGVFKMQRKGTRPGKGGSFERFTEKGADDSAPVEVVALDRTQTINGMQTSAFEVRGAPQAIVGWVTADHADVLEVFRRLEHTRAEMNGKGTRSPKDELTQQGLPVRVQTLDDRRYSLEDLVEVEAKPLSAELFTVPAGFSKTSPRQMAENAGKGLPH